MVHLIRPSICIHVSMLLHVPYVNHRMSNGEFKILADIRIQ